MNSALLTIYLILGKLLIWSHFWNINSLLEHEALPFNVLNLSTSVLSF